MTCDAITDVGRCLSERLKMVVVNVVVEDDGDDDSNNIDDVNDNII